MDVARDSCAAAPWRKREGPVNPKAGPIVCVSYQQDDARLCHIVAIR